MKPTEFKQLIKEEVRKALNEDVKSDVIKLGYKPDRNPINVNISTEDFLAILEPILPALTASVKKNAGRSSSAVFYDKREAWAYYKDYDIAMSKYVANAFNKLIKGSLNTSQKVSGAPQLPPFKEFDESYIAYNKANDIVRYNTTYGVFLANNLGDYLDWMESYGDSLSMYNNYTINKVKTALEDIARGKSPDVELFKLTAKAVEKRGSLPDFYKNIGKELKASLGTPSGKWIIDEDGEELWKKKNPSAEDLIKVYLKFLKNADINTQEEYVDANSSNIKSFSNWKKAIKDIAGETGDGYGYNITDDIVLVNIM